MDNFDNIKIVMQVLGNPTRLRIFDILMTGTHCNCEIAEKTGYAINLISHHLKALHEINLIQSERNEIDARWIYYSVNKQNLRFLQNELLDFLNLDRIENRDPACSPCSIKTSKEKSK